MHEIRGDSVQCQEFRSMEGKLRITIQINERLHASAGDADMAGDDDPLDLGRSLADIEEFLVSIMALYGVLLHESVTPVDLNGLIGHTVIHFRTEHLGHGRLL